MDAKVRAQDVRHSEPDLKPLAKIAVFSRSKEEKELIQMFRCMDRMGKNYILGFARREFEHDRGIPLERQKNINDMLSSFGPLYTQSEYEHMLRYRAIPVERKENVDILLNSFYAEIASKKEETGSESVVSMGGWRHGRETD